MGNSNAWKCASLLRSAEDHNCRLYRETNLTSDSTCDDHEDLVNDTRPILACHLFTTLLFLGCLVSLILRKCIFGFNH